jgi:predicted HAD superfamily Cof-like phosphohydrolase
MVEILDALADIGYILAGTIINHGMQDIYDDAFKEVHRSNMAKLVDGKVHRRDDGKVMKPDDWQPPNLARFLE